MNPSSLRPTKINGYVSRMHWCLWFDHKTSAITNHRINVANQIQQKQNVPPGPRRGKALARMILLIAYPMLQYVLVTGSEPDDTGSWVKWRHAYICACIEHTSHTRYQIPTHTYLLVLGSYRTILLCLNLNMAGSCLGWPHLQCDLQKDKWVCSKDAPTPLI